MIASAQFTIISLCDVVTSDTPPENPYEGQLWVDTSVTPPETKIYIGPFRSLKGWQDCSHHPQAGHYFCSSSFIRASWYSTSRMARSRSSC